MNEWWNYIFLSMINVLLNEKQKAEISCETNALIFTKIWIDIFFLNKNNEEIAFYF